MQRRRFLKRSLGTFLALTGSKVGRSPLDAADKVANHRNSMLGLLRQRMRGRLILPSDPDYLRWARSVNSLYDGVLPIAIALPESAEDVAACVKWSRSTGIHLGTKGGGHNYNGASNTRGLLVVTQAMNQVEVSPRDRLLRVQSGTLNGAILERLAGGNLILPVGTCPQVGVAGLTLGGGIGKNARWAGLTCDRLLSTDLVLASGDIVTASSASHPDLFWAVRGAGGGNLGIHTSLTYELVELISPAVSVVDLRYTGAGAARDVFHALDGIVASASNLLTSQFSMTTNPGRLNLPDVPAGRSLDPSVFPITSVQCSYQGPLADLLQILRPLFLAATPVTRADAELPFWEATYTLLNEAPDPNPRGFATVSRFANTPFSTSAVKDLVASLLAAPYAQRTKMASLSYLSWVGGLSNLVPADATAYVHRNATSIPNMTAFWRNGTTREEQARLLEWLDGAFDILRRSATHESYQNFPGSKVVDWGKAYYGSNLKRLMRVKRIYDPRNVFRHAQSVPLG